MEPVLTPTASRALPRTAVAATIAIAATRPQRTCVRAMDTMMTERTFDVKAESNICLKRPLAAGTVPSEEEPWMT